MITTTFLLLLISFECWYLTPGQIKLTHSPIYIQHIVANALLFRISGAVLFLIATASFIFNLGLASGIASVIFGLMAAGSLFVVLQPFQYLRIKVVAVLYFSILLLEIFI